MNPETRSIYAVSLRRRLPTTREWLLFLAQALLVAMIQVGNDVVRGNIWPPSWAVAQQHAQDVVTFERRHGFFVEPGIQIFFQHTHRLLGVTVTWHIAMSIANTIYALAHLLVTLAVALWVFLRHRRRFAFFRNVTLLTGVLALVGYETYPLAPPRLTTGLTWNGHPYTFQDTMGHIIGTGRLNGTPIGYNPLSAMPSLHVAWALIMGVTVVLLVRSPLLRLLGLLYPVAMTMATIVTANHYIMDAIGAAGAVALAAALSGAIHWLGMRHPARSRAAALLPAGGEQTMPPAPVFRAGTRSTKEQSRVLEPDPWDSG
jgi:hypothetical protein